MENINNFVNKGKELCIELNIGKTYDKRKNKIIRN